MVSSLSHNRLRGFWNTLSLLLMVSFAFTACEGSTTATKQTSSGGNTAFKMNMVPLVSDVNGAASHTDGKIVDAWGLEFGDPGRIWVNNSDGYSTVYDGTGKVVMIADASGKQVPLAVKIPVPNDPDGDAQAPLTGMVFSKTREFNGDAFVFASEQGTLSGWNPSMYNQGVMRVNNSAKGAVYKGLTSADTSQGPRLYAANFAQGTVDVFDQHYQPVTVAGQFKDPQIPDNYAPFNIKAMDGKIYIAYAEQSIDKQNDEGAVGHGYVDSFDYNGTLIKHLIANGMLNSPWGMALAPKDFGPLSNKLLVSNFRDGYIHAYDPNTGQLQGQVMESNGQPLQIDQLWSLTFGNDNGAGKHNQLFFSAGPSSEETGLFGRLDLA